MVKKNIYNERFHERPLIEFYYLHFHIISPSFFTYINIHATCTLKS